MADMSRRGMLASLALRSKTLPLRPPYGGAEELFHQECPSCVDAPCVAVCEEAVIQKDEQGMPVLVFKDSGCTFCQACAHACPKGVLSLENEAKIKATVSLETATCLAWNGVVCATCKDVCAVGAITFFGLYRPVVAGDVCTACGFCYGVCPVDAVRIQRREV